MLKFSSTLQAVLNATSSKLAWATTLKEQLGANVRVRCFRDANTSATDPAATGTEFLNMACTGGITVAAGKISNFGTATNVTVKLAADLTTGASVLRIEGNGHWVQGTLGLTGAATDFHMTANPTTASNIGVATSLRMNPPPLMASGTGYVPPVLDSDAPAYIVIEDWSSGSAVAAGTINFNNRLKNWVFEDAEYAANVGDTRVTGSTDMVTLGEFEFGAMLFSNNPAVNSVPGKAVHSTMIVIKPTEANWPNYPRQTGAARGGYRRGTRQVNTHTMEYGLSNTIMPPFKAKICKADGTVLHTHDMPKDGLPIGSNQLSDVATKTKAIRPRMNCGQVLEWKSSPPVLSSIASKIYPGVEAYSLRPSIGKERAMFNQGYPFNYAGQPQNSSGLWYAAPKWAFAADRALILAEEPTRNTNDPYLYTHSTNESGFGTPAQAKIFFNIPDSDAATSTNTGMEMYQGWGYEPGGWCLHDQWTGYGGKRIDRGTIPTPIAIHHTNPSWVHLRTQTPITEMVRHWNQGYFNQPYHHVTNVKTFDTIPVSEVLAGLWTDGESFYGGNRFYTDVDHTIPRFAPSQTEHTDRGPFGGSFVDANYHMPWGGACIDTLHNYPCPGWAALLYNSVTHAYSQKHRYLSSIMCHLGSRQTYPDGDAKGYFGMRNHAWRMLQHAMMWKLASDHPLGISRADVETRCIAELNAVYNDITKPLYVDNSQTTYFKVLRNMGLVMEFKSDRWYVNSMGLTFYMAHVLQFWRQSGMWRRMYDYSATTREALLTIVKMLDTACFGFFLDTQGCYIGMDGSLFGGNPVVLRGNNNSSANNDAPSGWADWMNTVWLPQTAGRGQADWIRKVDGTFKVPISDEHLRAQWPSIRKNYFADIPCAYDVDAVVTMVDGFYDTWNGRIEAAKAANPSGINSLRQIEWDAHPAYGRILPPTVLEP